MIEFLYFTSKTCGVCKVLKPKLLEAIRENFPKVNIRVVDVEEEAEFTGQSMVFTLPVGIIKADGKEMHRFVRSFSVYEVLEKIKRLIDNYAH